MKKKLVVMFLGVFLLCGCEMESEYEFTINEDKSMNLEIMMGFDDELIDAMISMGESNGEDIFETPESDSNNEEKEYTDEDRRNYLKESFNEKISLEEIKQEGFTVEEFQDEKYTGYKIIGKVNSIDNLIGPPNFNLDDLLDINSKKIFEKDGSIYKAKILVGDPTDMGEETNDSSSQFGINLVYNFTLNLPNKVKYSNATTVSEDGKTLTWNLSPGNISTIEFAFEFPSIMTFLKDNMILTAGIAVVVVLLIVVIITVILKNNKNKKDNLLNDISKVDPSESDVKKINDVNTIDHTQINQVASQNVEIQLEQNKTIINQTSEQIVQPQTNINNLTENQNINTQPSIESTVVINSQIPLQQQTQNTLQEAPTISINEVPIITTQNVKTETKMPEISQIQSVTQTEINNEIPEIKPVIPVHINVQTTNVNQETSFVTNSSQQNNNINN